MHELFRLEHVSKKLEYHQCPVTNINLCACAGQVQGILIKDSHHLDILYGLFTGQVPADSGKFYVNDAAIPHPTLPALHFELFGKLIQRLKKYEYAVIYFTRIWNHDFFPFTDSLNIVRQGTIIMNIPHKSFHELPSLLSFGDSFNQLGYEKTDAVSNTEIMLTFDIKLSLPTPVHIRFALEEQELLGIYDLDCQIIDLTNDLLTGRAACSGTACFGSSVYTLKNQNFINKKIGLITSRASRDYNYFPQMSIIDNVTLMILQKLCYPLRILNRRLQSYMFRKVLASESEPDMVGMLS